MNGALDLTPKEELFFVLYGEPTPWKRPRHNSRGKFVRFYNDKKHDEYMKRIRERAQTEMDRRGSLWDGPVHAKIIALFGIPKSRPQYVKRSIRAGLTFCTNQKDVDNLGKIVLDALNQVVYLDDRQVVDVHVRKDYAEKPRLLVKLSHLEGLTG